MTERGSRGARALDHDGAAGGPEPRRAARAPADPFVWSVPHLVAFRFCFVYFLLHALPFPISELPYLSGIGRLWRSLVTPVVLHVGEGLLHLPKLQTAATGSGDRMFDYVALLVIVVVAVVAAAIWSALDRGAERYPRLDAALRVYLRYWLATVMFGYGFAKLFLQQFPAPTRFALMTPYGESSPMRLLWTTMSFSPTYQRFGGAMEVIGGALLLSRRTALLGALVLVPTLANVVMMNFCFDVPVKLYSSHLLFTSIFLALPDARRVARVVFSSARAPAPAPLRSRNPLRLALKALVLAVMFGPMLVELTEEEDGPHLEIAGYYEGLEIDGARRWTDVEITDHFLLVKTPDGSKRRYLVMGYDAPKAELSLNDRFSGGEVTDFTLKVERKADEVELSGTLRDEPIRARLRKADVKPMPLMSRGFHWINEFPYNR